MTATLLAGAVSTPIMGRLGDLAGKRRMLLTSLAIMVVGSLVCGFIGQPARDDRRPCAAELAMGAIPLGIGLMRDMLPREKLGSAMALMSSSIGVGGGPRAAAGRARRPARRLARAVLRRGGLGVRSIVLTLVFVPESALRAQGTFDVAGALGLPLGLVLFLLPITKGSDWGWGRAPRSACVTPAALVVLPRLGRDGAAPGWRRWSTCAPRPAARCSHQPRVDHGGRRLLRDLLVLPQLLSCRPPPATASASRWSSRVCAWRRWA
ncbi:MFS transporter [Streptomyces sp. KL116D]|uniref:MFS transporter n=1 Tax=Streptomyces sp. KL116D TaxID=3045152 RepID=UPI003557DF54